MLAIVFGVIIILLVFYILYVQYQLRSINHQINKRLREKTRQQLYLQLINPELNRLVKNINNCLKAEEILRLNRITEEKHFKELIANISHDLRTPLTAIKGYQQLIGKDELSDDQRRKLQIAERHSNELGNLIEHFFEYSYLLNVESSPNIERINLTNLVVECIAESIEIFEKNNLHVNIEESESVFTMIDKEMTMRIIKNLIRNCMTHSSGDISVRIMGDKNAVISFKNPIKDTTTVDVERLFDRFYTADKARGKTTGLGLSIVKLLAEQMGGNAKAILQGTMLEICVELPLYKGA